MTYKRTLDFQYEGIFTYSFKEDNKQVICSITNCTCKVFMLIDLKHYSCNYCRNILFVESYKEEK